MGAWAWLAQVKWTDGWHVCAVTSVNAEKLEFNVQVLIGQAGQALFSETPRNTSVEEKGEHYITINHTQVYSDTLM